MPGPSSTSQAGSAAPERLAPVLLVGLLCALWSYGYDLWRLPPRLPGTVGLVLGGDVLPMLLVPALFARLALGRPLADYGWRWPGWAKLLGSAALAWLAILPVEWVLSGRPEFQAAYPSPAFPPARQHAFGLAMLWGLHHGPQLLSLEFLMRGFLLQPLARRAGLVVALVATGIPYVVLHAGKPPLELAQAALAAVAFGTAAWRTRSFAPAFLAHFAVAVSMDALCLARAG